VNEAVLLAIGTVAGTVLAALFKFIIDLRKSKGDAELAEREQVAREYRGLIEQLQATLAAERSRATADRQAQDGRHEQEKKDLADRLDAEREKATAYSVEREQLRGDLRVAQAQVNALRVAQIGSQASSWVDTLVVTDDDGTVIEWNQAAEILFHYRRDEAVGKNVEVLAAPAVRPVLRAALARVKSENRKPREGPYAVVGLTREGMEVPVEVTLTGWPSAGRWFYAASVRRRYEGGKS
jgi:PAS domain S-box-containing protein